MRLTDQGAASPRPSTGSSGKGSRYSSGTQASDAASTKRGAQPWQAQQHLWAQAGADAAGGDEPGGLLNAAANGETPSESSAPCAAAPCGASAAACLEVRVRGLHGSVVSAACCCCGQHWECNEGWTPPCMPACCRPPVRMSLAPASASTGASMRGRMWCCAWSTSMRHPGGLLCRARSHAALACLLQCHCLLLVAIYHQC